MSGDAKALSAESLTLAAPGSVRKATITAEGVQVRAADGDRVVLRWEDLIKAVRVSRE